MTNETANGNTGNLSELRELMAQVMGSGGTMLAADDDIQYHDLASILVPQGMSMEHLATVAQKKAKELNKIHTFRHITDYRPNDGAHAAAIVIKRMFGLSIGKETKTMFGENPPEFMTIDVAHNKKMEVPWGQLEIPALENTIFQLAAMDSERGPVFMAVARGPKKHKAKIEAFFAAIDEELRTNSIYRGNALLGAYELKFMDVTKFKASEIVFADDVNATLEASIFSLVEHTTATVEAGLSTKRSTLVFGPYGTGKSSLGLITAQRATKVGWTFLSARAGRDDLKSVLQTASLYQPAVVFVEDIDAHTPKASDKDGISELLDLFDGIGTKNDKVCVVMTTNHIKKVPAGMLRPGRLDYCVEVSGLDRGATERLIKQVIRRDLLDSDIDYDAIYDVMADWQPAWLRAAADRAQSFAISRNNGALSYSLNTADLIGAAKSLAPQLKLMGEALEGYHTPELTDVLTATINEAAKDGVKGLRIVDQDNWQISQISDTADPDYSWNVVKQNS